MIPMRELVSHSIGGGWGEELRADGTEQVAIIRGADFPGVAVGDTSGVPHRWESVRKLPQRTLQPGDIVLEGSGGTSDRPTGRTVFISEQLLDRFDVPVIPASFCRLVRIDPALADPHYVYWWLQGMYADGRTWGYQNRSTGIANFQFQHFLDTETVRLPSLDEQRAIAATLGALDDKIESNRRAVELLQHVSAAVFRQWKRESVTVRSSTLGDYADVYGGATPKTTIPENWGGNLAWTTPTDVTGLSAPYLFETSRTITDEGLRSCTAVMHPAGTIFMTSRATIGAFAINQVAAATNQGFIAVRPRRDADLFFLFEEMRSRVGEFRDNANGSTFLEISRGRFKELSLSVPRSEDLDQLHARIRPLHVKAAQLSKESARLAMLRDTVLPELLSGRIHVPAEGVEA